MISVDQAEDEMTHHADTKKKDRPQQHHPDEHADIVDLLGHRAIGFGVDRHLTRAVTA